MKTDKIAVDDSSQVVKPNENVEEKTPEKSKMTGLIYDNKNNKIYSYNANWTPFVMKSINNDKYDSLYLKNMLNNDNSDYNDINNYNNCIPLILGGRNRNQTILTTMKCTINDINSIEDVTFSQDLSNLILSNDITYNNKLNNLENINLNQIGINKGDCTMSFYVSNHKEYGNLIIIINTTVSGGTIGYNIYSIDNDKYLFEKNAFTNLFSNQDTENSFNTYNGARGLLFDQSYVCIFF